MLSDKYNCVMCVVLLLLSTLSINLAENQRLRPPALDFSQNSIVHPVVLHGRSKREISTTRDTNGVHHLEVIMRIPMPGDEEYTFDLRLNEDLLADAHVLRYQGFNKTVVHRPTTEELDLCHYGGSVRDKPGSWVAVSTCHGVQGIVFDGERMRYIEPAQGGDLNSQHYIYEHADLTDPFLREYVSRVDSSSQNHSKKIRLPRYKRYASKASRRSPNDAFKKPRYVELVLVADKGLYQENNCNLRAVHRQMKTIANIINSVYSPLNIFIVLVGVEVWNRHDKIKVDTNPVDTLVNFVNYLSIKLSRKIPNDNAYLITQENFGVTRGKGFANSICTDISCGIVTNHTTVIGLLAMTVAHEMGHNLGMDHDKDNECRCPARKCIMNRWSTDEIPTHWSSCSLNSLKILFSKGKDYCLRNKPKRLFGNNGFLEWGE